MLARLAADGVDLRTAREVDFEHIFPSEEAAVNFQRRVEPLGYVTTSHASDEEHAEELEQGESRWGVTCTKHMVPTHEAISAAESQLAAIARQLGGIQEGWGLFGD